MLDAFGVLHQDLFHIKCLLKCVEQFLGEDQENNQSSIKFGEEEVQN